MSASLLLTCAKSQLREITAWALSNSSEALALISLEITLSRYSSTGSTLMVVMLPFSTIR